MNFFVENKLLNTNPIFFDIKAECYVRTDEKRYFIR